jgi:hypothetical protein
MSVRKIIRHLLPVVLSALLAWVVPSASFEAVLETSGHDLIDLLPASTVAAVELRDLDRRWTEIRDLPAVARFQDRVLGELGLEADDLPRLAGNQALLAFVMAENRRDLVPMALLRPASFEDATALLERLAELVPLALRRGRDALWIAPAEAARHLDHGHGLPAGSRDDDFRTVELQERLPDGGIVRGWLNPRALRELLLHQVEGTSGAPFAWLESMTAVELEAVRAAGFRRELTADGIVTDGLVSYHADVLPAEVARVLRSRPAPARLPDPLPHGVAAMAAFRPEPEAHLAWLRHVSQRDARGALRNLDFWIDAFEERTGRDVERDLRDLLGDQGWALAFEGAKRGTFEVAIVLEAEDPERWEGLLLDLRAFFMEHAAGRSLGIVVPRARDARGGSRVLHGMTLWSPLGEVEGPAFTVTGDHAVLATGERAVERSVRLLEGEPVWRPVTIDPGLPSPHEAMRVRASAFAPLAEEMLGWWVDEASVPDLPAALSELVSSLDHAAVGVWFEDDALRLRGRVGFVAR